MKTLLLILGVVAFVYLESGYSLLCASCSSRRCLFTPSVECPKDSTLCIKKWIGAKNFLRKYERGCAANCSTVTGDEIVLYCATDNCNN